MRFTNEPDFVRVYYDPPGATDLHLVSVKNVEFEVIRANTQGGASISADLEVSITSPGALDTLMRLEEDLLEDAHNFSRGGCFPGVENRMLLHRVRAASNKSTNSVSVVTRLRFLNGKHGDRLRSLAKHDRVRANIALMGLKLSRGDVFPVWRATRIEDIVEPPSVDSLSAEPPEPPVVAAEQVHEDTTEPESEESDTDESDKRKETEDDALVPPAPTKPPLARESRLKRLRDELVLDIQTKFNLELGGSDEDEEGEGH